MLSDLSLMADKIFEVMSGVFTLYTTNVVLCGVLALWLLRKVYKLFRGL